MTKTETPKIKATRARAGGAFVLGAALALTGAGAARAADDLPPALQTVGVQVPHGSGAWQVAAGFRASLVRGAGFDPFSTNDVLSQFSATATRAFRAGTSLPSVVGVLWEDGSSTAVARGDSARLNLSRLGVLVEQRWTPRPWAYAFVRLAPAWLSAMAALGETATPHPLEASFSTFGVDASAGIAGRLNPRSQAFGLWLVADAGYGWVSPHAMTFSPTLPAADRAKAGVTTFDDLKLGGFLFRSAVAVSY